MHGNNVASQLLTTWSYVGSAVAIGAVFVGLGGTIILAKIAATIALVALIPTVVISMIGGNGSGRLIRFARLYLGYTILAALGSTILGLVSVVSGILIMLGRSAFPDSSLIGICWIGFSPVLACLALHLMVTKVMKLPSPLTPSGVLAYGGSAASFGTTAVRQAESKVASLARSGLRKGVTALKSQATRGRPSTTSQGTQQMKARQAPQTSSTANPATSTSTARAHTSPDPTRTAIGAPSSVVTGSNRSLQGPPRSARAFARRPGGAPLTRTQAIAQNGPANASDRERTARLRRGREALAAVSSPALRARAAEIAPASTVAFMGPALELTERQSAKNTQDRARKLVQSSELVQRRPVTKRDQLPRVSQSQAATVAAAARRPGPSA